MNRYQNQLAGLSYPINLTAVLLHILAVFTIISSQLNCLLSVRDLLLWIGIPVLVLSLGIILVFKGYFLLVQHARLTAGFILLILALIHLTSLNDLHAFFAVTTKSNGFAFLGQNQFVPGFIAGFEFVGAIALIIGAWTRYTSVLLFFLFAFYTYLFFLQDPFGGTIKTETFDFKIDRYLTAQLNVQIAFTFSLFMAVICLVGVIFGHKIKPNSVRLNWGIIPVYTILAAGLAVVLHWYALIFIVPITISLVLIVYRSGGRFLGNHIGSLLLATLFSISIVYFQNELGIARKEKSDLKIKAITK